jgi:hypothetical protein
MNGVFFDPIKNQCIYFLLYMCICVCGSLLTHLRSVRKFLYLRGIRVNLNLESLYLNIYSKIKNIISK